MRILLVEDEGRLARSVVRGLQEDGHQVDTCDRGDAAIEQGAQLPYDVAILDWMLPEVDGLSVLRAWRSRGVQMPVLMLTARGETAEKVQALRAGADDYLVKPFAFDELVARLEALQRRGSAGQAVMQFGDLTLDARRRVLRCHDHDVSVTAREYQLLRELFEHAGDVLTRSELLARVWGPGFDGEPNVVDVYVGYLRKKISETGSTQVSVRTVRGVGFRLDIGDEGGK